MQVPGIRIIDLGRVAASTQTFADVAARAPLHTGAGDLRGLTEGVDRARSAVEFAARSVGDAGDGSTLLATAADELSQAHRVLTSGDLPTTRPFPFLTKRVDASEAVDLLQRASRRIAEADDVLVASGAARHYAADDSDLLLRGAERDEIATQVAARTHGPGLVGADAEMQSWISPDGWADANRGVRLLSRPLVGAAYRPVYHGAENVPGSGSTMLLISHGSATDPFVFTGALERPFRTMQRAEPFATPLKSALRGIGRFPIDRSGGEKSLHGLEIAKRVLDDGQPLMMAPEGLITNVPTLIESKHGAASLAIKTGSAVVPASAIGHELPYVRAGLLEGRGTHVIYGEPMYFRQTDSPTSAQVREVQELIQQEQAKLYERARELHRAGG